MQPRASAAYFYRQAMLRRPSTPILILCLLVLCIALVAWQGLARRSNKTSLPETGVYLALRPFQRAFSGIGGWFYDIGATMLRRNSITEENRRLRAQVANLDGQNRRLLRYGRENQELRRLLKMPRPWAGRYVPADIVSLNFTDIAQRVLINVGAGQGIRAKDVVFTAYGVVGHVMNTSTGTSQVLLLTDRQSGIGAMTGRTAARGVVQGTGGPICKMSYLDFQADVREGDTVLTSGDGDIFPRGLVIGRVMKVEKNKTYSRLVAYIEPAVPFDQISAVYVRAKATP